MIKTKKRASTEIDVDVAGYWDDDRSKKQQQFLTLHLSEFR